MKREPTEAELDQIAQSIAAGQRIEAINQYLSIAQCGLTEAQKFVHAMSEDLKVTKPDLFSRNKKITQRLFGKF